MGMVPATPAACEFGCNLAVGRGRRWEWGGLKRRENQGSGAAPLPTELPAGGPQTRRNPEQRRPPAGKLNSKVGQCEGETQRGIARLANQMPERGLTGHHDRETQRWAAGQQRQHEWATAR